MATASESAPSATVLAPGTTPPAPENAHLKEMSERFSARCAKGNPALSRHITAELKVDSQNADQVYQALMDLSEQQRSRVMSVFMNAIQYGE